MKFRRDRSKAPSPAERRARGLSTYDLIPWASNAMYEAGRSISAFQRAPTLDELEQAVASLETALAVLREAKKRHREDPMPRQVDPHLDRLLKKYQQQ